MSCCLLEKLSGSGDTRSARTSACRMASVSKDRYTRILFEQLPTNGPIIELENQRQHSVGLDRRPTLHDVMEEGGDSTALDVRRFVLPQWGSTSQVSRRASSYQLFVWTLVERSRYCATRSAPVAPRVCPVRDLSSVPWHTGRWQPAAGHQQDSE
jgi:hypothetical protein